MKNIRNSKQTEIGRIPKEWEVVKLTEICELIRGTEPGSKTYNKEGKGYRFIRVSDISKQILEGVFVNEKPDNLIFSHKDDMLLVLDGVPGVVAKGFEGAISSGIRIVKPKTNNIDKRFLFYILQHRIVQKIIENYTIGTTIKHASRAVDFIMLPLLPLPEQKKIAKILSTVDEAIEKVDESIKKTERLKKGLMQKLLTKGIGHKEFKDTEIGRIPKEWEAARVGEYIDVYSGYAFKSKDFLNDKSKGVAIIKIGNLQNGVIVIDQKTSYVSKKLYEELPDFRLNRGDVLVALSGATTGKISVVHKDFGPILVNQRVGKFKILSADKVHQSFFYYLVQSNVFKIFVLRNIGQSAQGNLSPLQLKKSLIPLPPFPEQKKIAEILSTVDKRLELLRVKKEKLARIKKGLMNDLLTGKRRVILPDSANQIGR